MGERTDADHIHAGQGKIEQCVETTPPETRRRAPANEQDGGLIVVGDMLSRRINIGGGAHCLFHFGERFGFDFDFREMRCRGASEFNRLGQRNRQRRCDYL